MGKNGSERAVEDLYCSLINFIGLHPLKKHSARLQTSIDGLIVFASEESGDPGAVWIRRLRDNDVVFVARGEQNFAGVANRQVKF